MMTTASRLALVATLLAAAPALAQPGQEYAPEADAEVPPAPQPQANQVVVTVQAPQPMVVQQQPQVAVQPHQAGAPQTDAWSGVSHINGQVVPVGERGNYLFKQKKMNISSNPIGWMMGFYGVSVSYALSDNIAIRGDLNYFAIEDSNETGYEYGVSLPIYFKRTYQGPFIEPGIIARGWSRDDSYYGDCYDCSSYETEDDTMVGPEMMFGYHLTFDSGLNVAAALGVARNMNSRTDEYGYTEEAVAPAGYFRVGYAF
ncbi:MAG: hypothetical protein H0T79_03245 [Deltaproteobacteria bacterium]|nr:hypothetical protein [Deltaproteobacteria bacterium]